MTQQDIFNITMDLIGERLDTGTIDATSTMNYKVRSYSLLTTLQSEIVRTSPLYKTITVTETGTNGYQEITIPSDFISIYQIYDTDLVMLDDYKILGNKLFVPNNFNGSIVYRNMPTTVTALTDIAPFSDYIETTVIPYGLASLLLLTENTSVASFFNQKYTEALSTIKRIQPTSISKKTDKYDASCSF